jgi:hypothetical protein
VRRTAVPANWSSRTPRLPGSGAAPVHAKVSSFTIYLFPDPRQPRKGWARKNGRKDGMNEFVKYVLMYTLPQVALMAAFMAAAFYVAR